jgi:hypothetical protein
MVKESLGKYGYTAFERWRYSPIIINSGYRQRWRDIIASYRDACEALLNLLAEDKYGDRMEGLAAVFLFRHFLEVSLKRIILNGRWLERNNKNLRGPVESVKNTHNLAELWQLVLRDAKAKMEVADWERYDIPFIEELINEFHARDARGFNFRYRGTDGDFCLFDHCTLLRILPHVDQILDGIDTCLVQTYEDNKEYEACMESEFGE